MEEALHAIRHQLTLDQVKPIWHGAAGGQPKWAVFAYSCDILMPAEAATTSGAGAPMTQMIVQILPMYVVQLFFAWPSYLLAKKTERSGWLMVFLSLVPILGSLILPYVMITSLLYALDRLPRSP